MNTMSKIVVLVFAFIFLISIVNAATTETDESACITDICDTPALAISFENWRVVAAMALFVSVLIIAIIYMVGKALEDNTLISRAKSELVQLYMTVLIVVIFTALISFLCSSMVSSFLTQSKVLYGLEHPSLIKAGCYYLEDLAGWTGKTFHGSFWSFSTLNYIKGFMGGWKGTPLFPGRTWQEITDLLLGSINVFFTSILTAHVITLAQIHLYKFIQPLSLSFLLPAGVVLRSFYPFRRFGGALIGIALGLIFFLPLLLVFNAAIMEMHFDVEIVIDTKCTGYQGWKQCCSKVCVEGECAMPMKEGATCEEDMQCSSGICYKEYATRFGVCKKCNTKGGMCGESRDCCKGFMCNKTTSLCVLAKKLNSSCTDPYECQTRFCIEGKCSVPKPAGDNCTEDSECYSRICTGEMKCANCKSTYRYIFTRTAEEQAAAREGADVMNIVHVGLVPDLAPPTPTEEIDVAFKAEKSIIDGIKDVIGVPITAISNLLRKMFDIFMLAVFGGIVFPMINFYLLSIAIRDLSNFFGSEIDVASLWRII